MDELFNVSNIGDTKKRKKKKEDLEKEERRRTIIVVVSLLVIATIASFMYVYLRTSKKIEDAKGLLKQTISNNEITEYTDVEGFKNILDRSNNENNISKQIVKGNNILLRRKK